MIATTTVAKAIAAGVAAATGLELWKHFHPQLQSLRHVGPTGAPIQVVVPVVDTPTKPSVAAAPIPPGNGSAATFTPKVFILSENQNRKWPGVSTRQCSGMWRLRSTM